MEEWAVVSARAEEWTGIEVGQEVREAGMD